MNYKDLLLNPKYTLEELLRYGRNNVPPKLYKYQGFFRNGKERGHWIDNVNGSFHLSYPCEFEDAKDCLPHMDSNKFIEHIEIFFKHGGESQEKINEICCSESIMKEIYNWIKSIENNYRSNILIGCFADSSNLPDMWKKYADDSRGFVVEYDTSKLPYFKENVLPVLYTDDEIDNTSNAVRWFIALANADAKGRTLEEDMKVMGKEFYNKMMKCSLSTIFIKRNKYAFEHEYRMYLFKSKIEELIEKSNLSADRNLNLSEAVSAIYLGEKFDLSDDANKGIIENLKKSKMKRIFQYLKEI